MRKFLAVGLLVLSAICRYFSKQMASLRMVGQLSLAASMVVLVSGRAKSYGSEALPQTKPATPPGVEGRKFTLELIGAICLVYAGYYFLNKASAAGGTETWPAYFFAGSLLIFGWVATSVFTRFK